MPEQPVPTVRPPGPPSLQQRRHDYLVPVLTLLAFASGVADGTSFLGIGPVLVANLTGNRVFPDLAPLGAPRISSPELSRTAIVVFLAGGCGHRSSSAGARAPAVGLHP
jgi:uncharacterized membrane protein YoaK (UPF0700 family)